MLRWWIAALVVVALLVGGCAPDQRAAAVVDALRAVPGVTDANQVRLPIGSTAAYAFAAQLEDDPGPEVLTGVVAAYREQLAAIGTGDAELEIRWHATGAVRTLKIHGGGSPSADELAAAARWPTELGEVRGFHYDGGLRIVVESTAGSFDADLARAARADLRAAQVEVSGTASRVAWIDRPPLAEYAQLRAAAPSATYVVIDHGLDAEVPAIEVAWPAGDASEPELRAVGALWAATPSPLALTLRVGGVASVAALRNDACPAAVAPRNLEFWALAAEGPLAPADC